MRAKYLLTRKHYDFLVGQFPEWMATDWLLLGRRWDIAGVVVEGSVDQINAVHRMMSSYSAKSDG